MGVDVGVALGTLVGREEEVGTGEAGCVGSEAALSIIPQALRIKDGMIQDSVRIFILFIPSL